MERDKTFEECGSPKHNQTEGHCGGRKGWFSVFGVWLYSSRSRRSEQEQREQLHSGGSQVHPAAVLPRSGLSSPELYSAQGLEAVEHSLREGSNQVVRLWTCEVHGSSAGSSHTESGDSLVQSTRTVSWDEEVRDAHRQLGLWLHHGRAFHSKGSLPIRKRRRTDEEDLPTPRNSFWQDLAWIWQASERSQICESQIVKILFHLFCSNFTKRLEIETFPCYKKKQKWVHFEEKVWVFRQTRFRLVVRTFEVFPWKEVRVKFDCETQLLQSGSPSKEDQWDASFQRLEVSRTRSSKSQQEQQKDRLISIERHKEAEEFFRRRFQLKIEIN